MNCGVRMKTKKNKYDVNIDNDLMWFKNGCKQYNLGLK